MLSVIIVTKNRSSDLGRCLASLGRQTKKPTELLIIDNNSTDATVKTAKSFAHNASYPVRIITEKRHGYPIIYNRGIKEAKYKWIAFIDDDCIASPLWIEAVLSSIQKYPHAAAILGLSETLFPHNPYAFTTYMLNYIWKENGSRGERVISGEILDNKNIVYNKLFLTKQELYFDETRIVRFDGASEDCDLGSRIALHGGQCFYCKSIRVKHKDPTVFRHFLNKFIRSYQGYLSYQSSFQNTHNRKKHNQIRLRTMLPGHMNRHSLSKKEKVSVYALLIIALCIKNLLLLKWNKMVPSSHIVFIFF